MLSAHDPAWVWSFLKYSRYSVKRYHGSFQLLATKHLPKNCRITFRAAMAVSPTNKQGKTTYYFEVRVNWDKLMAIDQHPSFALVFCMLFSLSNFGIHWMSFNCLGDIGCANLVSRVNLQFCKKQHCCSRCFFPSSCPVFHRFSTIWPPTYACWFMLYNPFNYISIYLLLTQQ